MCRAERRETRSIYKVQVPYGLYSAKAPEVTPSPVKPSMSMLFEAPHWPNPGQGHCNEQLVIAALDR